MDFSHIADPVERAAAIHRAASASAENARRLNDLKWGKLGDAGLARRCLMLPDAIHPEAVENTSSRG
jgi:hypothetical protein